MKKTRTSVANDLISGFKELAEALEAGEELSIRFNCYQMRLDLQPETYTPELVKKTRGLLAASQAVFAKFLGVSIKTVRQWEQGLGTPSQMACRFMDEIRRNPDYYVDRIRQSIVPKRSGKHV